jgi:hypothetical protein
MEDSRCKIAAIVGDDPQCKCLFGGVVIEAEDPRYKSLYYGVALEMEDLRCKSVTAVTEDPRCMNLRMAG